MNISQIMRSLYLHVWRYREIERVHRRYVEKLDRKRPVNVVFFAMSVSMWRYQHLYELLAKDGRFNATIVLSPSIDYTLEQQRRDVEQMRAYFGAKGISFVDCDVEHAENGAFDVATELNPDVIFYPQPYENLLVPEHDCKRFYDKMICYYPYAFWTSKGKWSYNFHFHNMAWRLYYSTALHLKEAQKTAQNKGRNVRVVGYANADDFLAKTHKDNWRKIDDGKQRKRLIWAPHYAIVQEFGLIQRSNFLWLAQLMVDLAERYADRLQIAFKPHPRLLTELYRHKDWGKAKTDAYYEKWATMPNTQLETGEFVDLFMTGDAMVHDSGSFAVEYHYSQNPVMFVSKDIDALLDTQSDFGKLAYKMQYIGKNAEDVVRFVEDIVLGGSDQLKPQRKAFFNDYLLPPNGKTVAENTLDDLVASLGI